MKRRSGGNTFDTCLFEGNGTAFSAPASSFRDYQFKDTLFVNNGKAVELTEEKKVAISFETIGLPVDTPPALFRVALDAYVSIRAAGAPEFAQAPTSTRYGLMALAEGQGSRHRYFDGRAG